MKEFRVSWCQCPTYSHSPRVLFVEALNANDAKKLASDFIERQYGIGWFVIRDVSLTEQMPQGRVKTEGRA